jgi:predicted flap endonuclease-1-like 5' DNA nuclease
MSYQVESFEMIDEAMRQRLVAIGIRTTGELIQRCGTPEGRAEIAKNTGAPAEAVLNWVHLADLMRIDGVGNQFAELLDATGVGTMTALRAKQAGRLETELKRVNSQRKIAKTTPSAMMLERWIDQARTLPHRVIC